jgi:mono/diheme cytochrome c family protein
VFRCNGRMGRRIAGSTLMGAALFCGIAIARKAQPTDAELAARVRKAPAAANSWRNPYEGKADAIAAGKKLFKHHCAECHAPEVLEKSKAADLRSPVLQNAPPGVLFWLLKNGNRGDGMPAWSALPDQQRWQLVTYLKSLGPASQEAGAARPPEAIR